MVSMVNFANRFFVILTALFLGFLMVDAAGAEVISLLKTGDSAPGYPGETVSRLIPTATTVFLAPPIIASETAHIGFTAEVGTLSNKDVIFLRQPSGVISPVARKQSAVPDLQGLSYAGMSAPLFAKGGIMYFTGNVYGSGVTSANDLGVFTHMTGVTRLAARENDPAFGLTDGALYSDFRSLSVPSSVAPKLLFNSLLKGSGVNGANNFAAGGVQLSSSGVQQPFLSLRVGQYAPGETDGARFLNIVRFDGPSEKSVFGTNYFGVNLDPARSHGLYTDRTGALTKIVRAGDAVPGMPGKTFASIEIRANGNIPSLGTVNNLQVNSNGRSVFQATLAGDGVTIFNERSLWTDRNGYLELVARNDDQVPGAQTGVKFYGLSATTPRFIAADGTITLISQTKLGQNTIGLVVLRKFSDGSSQIILDQDITLPGYAPGAYIYEHTSMSPSYLRWNANGNFVLYVSLEGEGITDSNRRALVTYIDGEINIPLREGQIIDGCTLTNIYPSKMQINEQDQLVVGARVLCPPNQIQDKDGLIAINSDGVARLVANPGMTLPITGVSPSPVAHAASSIVVSDNNALADDGKVVFAARFTDNSERVLLYQIEEGVVILPQCPADFDGNGVAQTQDIFAFLGAWFAGNPSADFDGNGSVQVQDIFAFLNAWFVGC